MADAATAVAEQVLETITTAQDATLKVLKGWTDTLASTPYLSEYYVAPKIDTFYGFAEKLLAQAGLLEGSGPNAAEEAGEDWQPPEATTTEAAIRLDPALTDAQKEALLAVYRGFVGGAAKE